jgi:hypothetical protein
MLGNFPSHCCIPSLASLACNGGDVTVYPGGGSGKWEGGGGLLDEVC